jgi:hypothetical protein
MKYGFNKREKKPSIPASECMSWQQNGKPQPERTGFRPSNKSRKE